MPIRALNASRKTKHTPVGQIPVEWTVCSLGHLVDIKHGFAFKSQFFSDTGRFIVLTPGNFFEDGGFRSRGKLDRYYRGEFPKEYLLTEGDLIVAMTEQAEGLLGSPAIVPAGGRYLHNQRLGLVSIRCPEQLDREFLFRLLNTTYVRRHISITAGGTKVKHTSPAKILSTAVALPPLPEQRKIAEILSTWDRAIEQTEKLIDAKERLKKGLMQQLLTGKLRFPQFRKSTSGLSETRFGLVPSDWPYLRVDRFAREVNERHEGKDETPVLSCTKYAGLVDSLSYFGKRVFSEDTAGYKVVRRGQFAYATNHIEEGSIGLLEDVEAGLVSPMYTVFEVDSECVHAPFLYNLLKTELYRHIFGINTSASVDRRGSLRWSQFRSIRVALPGLEEQRAISACSTTAGREVAVLRKQLSALQRQKRGLMQKLLTGKVRVYGG